MFRLLMVTAVAMLPACTVLLEDKTGQFFHNSPNNEQTFRAETTERGSVEVTGVRVDIDDGPNETMTASGTEWTRAIQFINCAGPVFYRYEVTYDRILLGSTTQVFPEAGRFSRVILNLPSDCPDVPQQGGSVFEVNNTEDLPDANPGDGICAALLDGDDACTLRAAVMEANALPGTDRIEIERARYVLSQTLSAGTESDAVANDAVGDLDITDSVVIVAPGLFADDIGRVLVTTESIGTPNLLDVDTGESLDRTDNDALYARVDGGEIDRVFQVHDIDGGEGFAVFENFAIVNGLAFDRPGAGIRNDGILRLDRVIVAENRLMQGTGPGGVGSENRGAGIANFGFLQGEELAVVRNRIGGITGFAGGLYNEAGSTAVIERGLFAFNEARFSSAIYNQNDDAGDDDASLMLANVTVTENRTTASVRGAIINDGDATLTFVSVLENAGAAVGVVSSPGATTRMGSTVLDNNGQDCSGDIISLGSNAVSDTSGCALLVGTGPSTIDFLDVAPIFSSLSDNGGFLYTIRPIIPSSGSSLFDVVDRGQGFFAAPTTDARGPNFDRNADGDGDGDAMSDIGAFEIQ